MSDTPTTFANLALLMAPGSESGYKGVSKNGKDGWQARAGPKDARRHLGTFSTKVEAAVAVALDGNGIAKEDNDPHHQATKHDPATLMKPAGGAAPHPATTLPQRQLLSNTLTDDGLPTRPCLPAGKKRPLGLISAAPVKPPAPPPIQLPDYAAPHIGRAFGPKRKPGDDPRIRPNTPPVRPFADCYGFPITVQAKPLAMTDARDALMHFAQAFLP